jgi:hypothetical protein
MNPDQTSILKPSSPAPPRRVFTVAQATSTLVLVRKIVRDIVARYRQLMTLREQRQALALLAGQAESIEQLDKRLAAAHDALANLQAELSEVGCVLKDWADGLVDFPAEYQGRAVWLCWRLDEPTITHWHEADTGYAGRHPIPPDFS